jgi:phospholipid/cholesterol/gamma-HCH transport system substrate-binding protein
MTRNPLFREFLTGLFAMGALVGLCAILVLFGEAANILERSYRFTITLASSAGLGETSPVTLNGLKIGQVKRSSIRESPGVGVELELEIKRSIGIPRCAKVGVDKGFVGDASLEFTVPQTATPEQLADVIKPGEVYDGGAPQTMVDRITATLEKPLQRLSESAESIDQLARTYTEVGERVKDLLEPRTLAQVEAGMAPNLRSTMARLDAALAGADKWLNDEDLRTRSRDLLARADRTLADLSALADSWRATAGKVDGAVGTLDATAAEVRTQVREVSTQAMSMLRRTENAAGSLAEALETATKGPGTVGQLMQNPDLYRSLKSTADRLDKVLEEFQLMVEKFKAEGIPLKL